MFLIPKNGQVGRYANQFNSAWHHNSFPGPQRLFFEITEPQKQDYSLLDNTCLVWKQMWMYLPAVNQSIQTNKLLNC